MTILSGALEVIDAHERGGRHRTGVLDAIAAVRRGEVGRVATFLARPAAPIHVRAP